MESADADEVTSLARLYDSAACQRLVWARSRSTWYHIARPVAYTRLAQGKQEVQYLHAPLAQRVGYVMNQKAASTWISRTMCTPGADRSPWVGVTDQLFHVGQPCNCSARLLHTDRDPGWNASDAIFTFVRSPMQTAFSAYLEVARRSDGMSSGPSLLTANNNGPRYRNMTCGNVRASTDRFEAYLDDIEQGRRLGGEVVHSFPQAIKIFFPPSRLRSRRFSAIGRLESLHAHLAQMRSVFFGAAHPEEGQAAVVSRSHNPADGRGRGTTRKTLCHTIDWERESLLLRLCRVYLADFTCFNYTIPQVCQQHAVE